MRKLYLLISLFSLSFLLAQDPHVYWEFNTEPLESGNGLWYYYSDEITEEATNESGFTGLPAGSRNWVDGSYEYMGSNGAFWSSYGINSGGFYRSLEYDSSTVTRYGEIMGLSGFSVRCLGD